MNINISIWGWKGLGVVWGHVGHVMISNLDNEVILSQYPHKYGQKFTPRGPNTKFSFKDTYNEEKSTPDVIFSLVIKKNFVESFVETVNNHTERKIWDWDPKNPSETHCTRSAYEALKSGGVLIDQDNVYKIENNERKEILPNSVWYLLDDLGIKPIMQKKDNLLQKIIEDNEKIITFARHQDLWN